MTGANPWALTAEQAAARDNDLLKQFIAAKRRAEQAHADPERVAVTLRQQFGADDTKQALLRAINRRMAAEWGYVLTPAKARP